MFSDTKKQKDYFTIRLIADSRTGKEEARFVLEVPEGTEGAVSRVNKADRTVWEVSHESYTGIINDITIEDSKFGKMWNIDFIGKDNKEITLQLGYSSQFAKSFIKRVPNIDFSQEITLKPYFIVNEGKETRALTAYQGDHGNKVEPFYTKDQPNGLPQWEKITVQGKEVWDSTKETEFLYAMVKETLKQDKPTNTGDIKTIEAFEKAMNSDVPVIDEDDLDAPF